MHKQESEILQIKINNWSKYQKGQKLYNRARFLWFRFENTIFDDPEFISLGVEGQIVWIFLLCQTSGANHTNGVVKTSYEFISMRTKVNISSVKNAIKKIESFKWLAISSGCRPDTLVLDIDRDRDIDKKKIISTEAKQASFDASCEPLVECKYLSQLLNEWRIKKRQYESWLNAYENASFVENEIKKAAAWLEANPGRRPKKNVARFITNWLSRAWESFRKTNKLRGDKYDAIRKY